MRLTPNGTGVLSGGGAGPSLIGGPVLLPSAGLGTPIDDAAILAVQEIPWGQPGAVATLKKIDLTTGAIVDFGAPGNQIAGGFSEWAIGVPGSVRWSFPQTPPLGAAVGDVDPFTGIIVLKVVNGHAHDLLVCQRSGHVDRIFCTAGVEWVRIRHGRVLYVANDGSMGCFDVAPNGLVPVANPAALMRSQFLPVNVAGEWWVAYPTFDALKHMLVCHPWADASVGVYADAAPPIATNWDVIGTGQMVIFAWSIGANETPGEGRLSFKTSVDLVDLRVATAKPPASITQPTIEPLPHFAWCISLGQPNTKYDITWVGGPVAPNCRGILYTVDKDTNWAQAVAMAKQYTLPIYAYCDRPRYSVPVPDGQGAIVIPTVQAYPIAGEPVAESLDRIHQEVVALKFHYERVAVLAATYRQWNGTAYALEIQQVLDVLDGVHEIAALYWLDAILMFEWARAKQPDGSFVDGAIAEPHLQQATLDILASPSGSETWPIDPSDPIDPIDPDEPEELPVPIVSDADFQRHAAQAADLVKGVFPPDMTHADITKACENWGNRPRSQGVNALHRDMAPGAYAATRNERPHSTWPTPTIDNSQAKYWDDLVKRAVDLDRKEGL